MRVTHRTAQALVIEDAPDLLLASICLGLGSFGILIGWTQAPSWIFVIVGTALLLAGLKFLVAGTRIHCFERDRGLATIKLKKAWQSPRIERELRLDSIEDVVLRGKASEGRPDRCSLLDRVRDHRRRAYTMERLHEFEAR
jgi:hypothetical protein